MKHLNNLVVGMMVMALFVTFAPAAYGRVVAVSVRSDNAMLDGTPYEFNLRQFTSDFRRALVRKLTNRNVRINKDKYDYKIRVTIVKVSHKMLPFHPKPTYILEYRYTLQNARGNVIDREIHEDSDGDRYDLIEHITDRIMDQVFKII